MSREDNRQIAAETIEITKDGKYSVGGRMVSFGGEDVSKVIVIRPSEEVKLQKTADGNPSYKFVNADTFEAARTYCKNPLVMNFASAKNPGGGFESGASAQEESLCRASTLFASLSSSEAAEMYDYNNKIKLPCYSDYMLLSPNVYVFRNPAGVLLRNPFKCGVISVPAPNKSGPARNVPDKEIERTATNRLRKMFITGINNGYKDIVLGAWGCGVFQNEIEDVAGYFRKLLIDEGLEKYFNNIVFAVYHDSDKLEAMQNILNG